MDVETLNYFGVPGTLEEIAEYTQKVHEKKRQSLDQVQQSETVVKGLLTNLRYIESKHSVEKLQVRFNFFKTHGYSC